MSEQETSSYDLEPGLAAPELPGSVRVGIDIEQTLDFLAADLFVHASNCVSEFGDFHLALSHGSIQERLMIKLMVDPKYRSFPWTKAHLWSVSEPTVPPGHEEHSMTHWKQIVVEGGGIPDEQIHCICGHQPAGAGQYASELTEHLEWRERGHDRLDFVLFGDEYECIRGFDDPAGQLVGFAPCQSKIVMTRRLINASRFIAIVGIGRTGRDVVVRIEKDHTQIGFSPPAGVLRWYLDGYACQHTNEESQ